MSSLSAMRGTAFTAGYAASKAWNLVFAESLADELRDTGVDVLTVSAGERPGREDGVGVPDREHPEGGGQEVDEVAEPDPRPREAR